VENHYNAFENMSVTADFGVIVLDACGQAVFESSVYSVVKGFLHTLHTMLDCEESSRIALLYGCYQARRFGGRYIFFAPSGLLYCAAPLLYDKGQLASGVLAGPFVMADYDDFLGYGMPGNQALSECNAAILRQRVRCVPCRTPKQIQAVSEHLSYVVTAHFSQTNMAESVSAQADFFPAYPLAKEEELLLAISKGEVRTAEDTLQDMIKQMIFHCNSNLEVLRSRVVELTALLSRAAIKGGADANAILGLNYNYLREIDKFSSMEDIVLWLQMITRRFTQQVFEFSGAKHLNIIYNTVNYIKRNYAEKITLKDISDNLFISQSYLCRIFKEETGQTPGSYISSVRIEASKKLLCDLAVHIIDIPKLVGFEDQSYFTRVFKRLVGVTPGRYRQQNLNR